MAISSSFKAKCPSCAGLVLIRDPKLIGKKVECPKCKARFIVEDPAEQDRNAVTATAKNGGPLDGAEDTPRPSAKKDAVAAGSPRVAAKPPAKAAPPADLEDDLEEVEEAPKAKTNGKAANGKAANGNSTSIKANGKAPAKAAPADEDDEKPKAKSKAAAKRVRDEDDEEDEEKPKGKKKKKAGNKGSQKLLIGVGLAVLGVAGLVVAFLMMKKGDATKTGGGTPVAKGNDGGGVPPMPGPGRPGPDGANPNGDGTGEPNPAQPGANPDGNPPNTGRPGEGGNPKNPPDKGGRPDPKDPPRPSGGPRNTGAPAGVELTNLLPRNTQGVFQLNFKDFLDSPMATAAFDKGGPFDNEELRRDLGFWVTSLDRLILGENYADGWAFNVLHTLDPIDNLSPLKRALGLKPPQERAIKNQDYYLITRNSHWLANLGRLSLGGPAHVRNAQPKAPNPAAPLYFRLHNRQTMIVAHLQPMRDFLAHEGRFEPQSSPAPPPSGRPQGFPGQPPPGAFPPMPPGAFPPPPGGAGQAPSPYGPGQGQSPPGSSGQSSQAPSPYGPGQGQPPLKQIKPAQPGGGQGPPGPGQGRPRPMPPGMIPPGQQPPGQEPAGQTPPAQQPPPPTDAYVTISPALKAMLDRMGKHAEGTERVIFVSATDMRAAHLSARGQADEQRVVWRVRPVWDVTNLLNERKDRMSVLGTGLLMKDQMTYTFTNAMQCPSDKDTATLTTDLSKKVAPDLARVLRLILNGHKIDLVKEEAPPPAPTGDPRFPPGMPPPGVFPPGQNPPGGFGRGPFPPGQGNPNGEKGEEKKEEPKGSRILVTSEGHEVLFRLELVLDQPAYRAMTGALQVVMMGLRAEIDVASGSARRHDLALAGKRLGEQGLSDRRILPGHFPPGAFPPPPSGKWSARAPGQRVSWMAGLLPYMGHGDLYRRIDFNRSWKDPANWLPARSLVPEFIDPTFPRRLRYTPYPGLPLEAASTHYVGLAGIGLDAAEYSPSDPAVVNKLGVFGYDRAASLKEIGEGRGLSNTILMIRTPYDGPAGVTPWMAGGGSTVRTVPDKNSAEPFFSTDPDGRRGTYVLMTDGSVRYVKKGISDEAFKAMVTVRGPAPRDFDIDEVAPKVEPPKKDEAPPLKEEDLKPEPPAPKDPPMQPPAEGKGPKVPPAQGGAKDGWQVYAPPGGRCSVEFPAGEVKKQSQPIPLPAGKATMLMYGIDRGDDGALMLMYSDFPPAMVPAGQEALFLDGVSKGMTMKLPGAKVTGQRDLAINGNKGRELTVDLPGKGGLRVRTYLVGVRVYILMAGGPGGKASGPEATHFLDSFKLQAGGGQPVPPNPGGGGQPVPPNPVGGQPFPGGGQPVPPNPGGGQPNPGPAAGGGGAISADDLAKAYQTDRAAAEKLYTKQIITVQGRKAFRMGNSINLKTDLKSKFGPGTVNVSVKFRNKADANNAAGMDNITAQGRCQGLNPVGDLEIVDAQLVGGATPAGGQPNRGRKR